jgi:DNA-binding Xre family transcriptional regulator
MLTFFKKVQMVSTRVPLALIFYDSLSLMAKGMGGSVMGKIFRVKIEELTKEYNISLRELGRQLDITHSTLSHLKNQKGQYIYREHIEKIMDHFNITDMNKLFEAVEDEDDDD